MKSHALLPALAALLLVCAGCEHDKETRSWYAPPDTSVPSREPAKSAPGLIGEWELTGGETTWYLHFRKDGTWRITEDRAGTQDHVYGNYTADDASFQGDMTNPGVGTGSISGYYNGRSLALDFVENWHDPAKHVSYTGKKL